MNEARDVKSECVCGKGGHRIQWTFGVATMMHHIGTHHPWEPKIM